MKEYLDLVRDIKENGVYKGDRTGTGCYSVFGRQMRFDLAEGFPLVTSKRTHLKSIIHELLWFLQGETNIRYLKANGVSIWDEWIDPDTAVYEPLTHEEICEALRVRFKVEHEDGVLIGTAPPDQPVDISFRQETESDPVTILVTEEFWEDCEDAGMAYRKIAEFYGIETERLVAGELGPVYGKQWRSWPDKKMRAMTSAEMIAALEKGAKEQLGLKFKAELYEVYSKETDFTFDVGEEYYTLTYGGEAGLGNAYLAFFSKCPETHKTIDQITNLIDTLKNNPDSRRMIVSAWNPAEVDDMALPPCHTIFQFYTAPMSVKERVEAHNRTVSLAEREHNQKTKDGMDNELITWAYLSVPGLRGWSHAKPNEEGLLPDEDAHAVLDRFEVPSRKLSCQLYQRKLHCALVA